MIKIAIVEDKEETLDYLAALLGGSNGMTVVGAYATGGEAVKGIPLIQPDVALVDIGLPDISGFEVIKEIRAQGAAVDILAHTMYEDREHLVAALKAGATGYILKGATPLEIIQAIEAVVAGGSPMSPKIARYLIEDFHGDQQQKEDERLTPQEKEVLLGIARGLTESKLAGALGLSPHTVHSHVKSIYRKLHASTQAEAVLKAKRKGLM